MKTCGTPFLGLDIDSFWRQMARCFEPLLSTATPDRNVRPEPEMLPILTLDPPPETWPDPAAYVGED
jgi:hypothetical protein